MRIQVYQLVNQILKRLKKNSYRYSVRALKEIYKYFLFTKIFKYMLYLFVTADIIVLVI